MICPRIGEIHREFAAGFSQDGTAIQSNAGA